uniref:Uncharacterized protein n=1 Tax=Rhizophora mucronata TaxID=61149 RepID=A0A2P2QQZ1_RHIMU
MISPSPPLQTLLVVTTNPYPKEQPKNCITQLNRSHHRVGQKQLLHLEFLLCLWPPLQVHRLALFLANRTLI